MTRTTRTPRFACAGHEFFENYTIKGGVFSRVGRAIFLGLTRNGAPTHIVKVRLCVCVCVCVRACARLCVPPPHQSELYRHALVCFVGFGS